MNPELLDRVLKCDRLPSMPAVAMRVIELTSSNRSSMREIAEVITNDQGLSSKVLKTVNSSFYGLSKPCTTINQSIVMLGLNAVKTLALGFSLVASLTRSSKGGFDYQAYWRRGLLTGVAAKCIAAESRIGHDEECFLAGLLQDVGMVAFHEALGEEYGMILDQVGGDHRQLARTELAELEMTHADVGSMLAGRWKLPPELAMPIKFHERPTAAPQEYLEICQAVGLGNIAADVLCAAEGGVALKRYYAKAQEWFSLSPMQADAVMNKISAGAKEIAKLLEVDAGSFNDPEAIRKQANEQLLAVTVPFGPGGQTDNNPLTIEDTDTVTMLPSRRILNQNMIATVEQFQAGGGPFSMGVFAVDGFGEIEIQQGAEYADEMLAQIASILRTTVEPYNAVCFCFDRGRFAVLMGGTDRITGTKHAERFRAAVAGTPLRIKPPGLVAVDLHVTISAGLITMDTTTRDRFTNVEIVFDTIDRALASAQKAGSNILRVFIPKSAAA
ncbi:MAG: HDOD domain-containing protein [Phycisphaerales bacterium]|nr:HDOD domain-containing protein [Phycisphaerales bacterium]